MGHHMSMLSDRAILVKAQVVCAMTKSKREPQAVVDETSNISWLGDDAAARGVVESEEGILVLCNGVVSNKLDRGRNVVVHAEFVEFVKFGRNRACHNLNAYVWRRSWRRHGRW